MKNLIYNGIATLFLIYSGLLYSQSPVPCSSGTLFNSFLGNSFTIPDTNEINFQDTRNRTIEFWFKSPDITITSERQVIYEEGGATNAIYFYLEAGRIHLGGYREISSTDGSARIFRSGIIQSDTWYHLALTIDDTGILATNDTDLSYKWYLNGQLQDTQSGPQVDRHTGDINLASNTSLRYPNPNGGSSVWIDGTGDTETYTGEFTARETTEYDFTGNIAFFRIWNVAREQVQINTNKSTLLTSGTALVAYLDQDLGAIEYIATDDTVFTTLALNANSKILYFEIPSSKYINEDAVTDRTIEFNFIANDVTTRQVLFEHGSNPDGFNIFIESGRLYLGAWRQNASQPSRRRFFRSGTINVNQEYHVALTLSSVDNTLKWYLNGQLKDSQNGLEVRGINNDVNIGRTGGNIRYPSDLSSGWTNTSGDSDQPQTYNGVTSESGNENQFLGVFSFFRIWNTPRSQTDIFTNQSVLITSANISEKLIVVQDRFQLAYDSNENNYLDGADEIIGPKTGLPQEVEFKWNGGNASFSDASNWVTDPAGDLPIAPNSFFTQNITIQAGGTDPVLTTAVNVGFLTIELNATLTINSGATLNVYFGFENNGTVTVEDGGSLIYHNCNSPITTGPSGSFNVQRNTRDYGSGTSEYFSYWSSPVVSAAANIGTLFPDAETVYTYDASSNPANWSFEGTGVNMDTGVGYAIQNEGEGGQLRFFSGAINQGAVTVTTYFNPNFGGQDGQGGIWSGSGDNLVGNPYASAIDWDKVITDEDNSKVSGTVYIWNQDSAEVGYNNVSDYLQYNMTGGTNTATGNIASGQGFFIKATEASTITFKPTHQINGANTDFYRGKAAKDKGTKDSKKQNRSWFTFTRGTQVNSLLVGFLEGATNQFDRLYDAPFDTGEVSLAFYSLVKKKYKASIQGLPLLKRDKKVVKLGFTVDQTGEHTIAIQEEHIDSEYYIYLRDREKKVTVDLRQRSYTFTIDSIGENNTRFKLIYTKKKRKATTSSKEENPIVTEIDSKDFSVYVDEVKDLIIEYDYDQDNIKEASLYTIRGQRVQRFDGKLNLNVAHLKTGIYLVEATLLDGRKRRKKLVIAK